MTRPALRNDVRIVDTTLRDGSHAMARRCGELGYVGGQEDMIIDVALALAHENPAREQTAQEKTA